MLGSGEETEDIAMSYEKVARCYTWPFNQDFDKAEQYFRRAEQIRTRLKKKLKDGGTEKTVQIHYIYDAKQAEIRIGENYMEMGRMFQMKNDYFKALHYAELFEEILLRLEKENSSGLAYAYYDKGICYYNIGISYANIQPDEAKKYMSLAGSELKRALEINMRMRGGLAVDTIDNQEALGDVYAAEGEKSDAANCYLAALSMAEQLLGNDSLKANDIKRKMANL